MKEICNSCAHQDTDGKGGVKCGACEYTRSGDYGPFKRGCVCIHDEELKDKFKPRGEDCTNVHNMSLHIKGLKEQLSALRDENRTLRERLTKI